MDGFPDFSDLDVRHQIRISSVPDQDTINLRQRSVLGTSVQESHVSCNGRCQHLTSPSVDPEMRPPGRYPPVSNPTFVLKNDCKRPLNCHCCGGRACPDDQLCSKICCPQTRLSRYCNDYLNKCAWSHYLQEYKSFWSNCRKFGSSKSKFDRNL